MPDIAIGEATISLKFDSYLRSEEFQGSGAWTFNRKELERAIPADFDQISYAADGSEREWSLWEELAEENDDENSAQVVTSNSDLAILILYCFGTQGGNFNVECESEGSSFWAFHDIEHAKRDIIPTDNGAGIVISDPMQEENAHVFGAIEAIQHGISLAEVAREIVNNETDFRTRFAGRECNALDRLLSSIPVGVA